LELVILCWFVPLTLTVVVGAHFKFQYWLPSSVPLLSNLVLLFPEPRERLKPLPQQAPARRTSHFGDSCSWAYLSSKMCQCFRHKQPGLSTTSA
jgi:hypothetical protein